MKKRIEKIIESKNSNDNDYYIAVDIGKKNCVVCITDKDGSILEETKYNNTFQEAERFFFEKVADRKFLFNVLSNDKFELEVSKSKEEYNDKPEYQIIYRANNLYQFIKNLLMLREYLIKNFSNK